MKELHANVSIEKLCGLFGYTRQNFYKTGKTSKKRNELEDLIIDQVKAIRIDQPRIGTVKLQYLINQKFGSQSIGRDKLHGILEDRKMLIRRRKKFRPKVTDGNGESLYPDLRKGLKVNKINQLWCSDITYIELRTREKHCYLVCVTDEYSHLIVGYHLGLRMKTWQVLQAMQMAVESQLKEGQEAFEKPVIIHSDRGSQYMCTKYTKALNNLGCHVSVGFKAQENAYAERINRTIKQEYLIPWNITTFPVLKRKLKLAVEHYNNKRIHNHLPNKLSPVKFENLLENKPNQINHIELIYAKENYLPRKYQNRDYFSFSPQHGYFCPVLCN